jgi:DNA-binding transcriptional LysR family regulator
MKMGFEVFLTVCEEMSITKAAKKLFITQQAVSDHIHRLEDQI